MGLIINVRGTGGSGKSTVVRRVMDNTRWSRTKSIAKDGRKRPHAYHMLERDVPRVVIPGHYETACGGCDTLKSVDEVFDVVRQGLVVGSNVLFEGIMVGDDVRRTLELAQAGHRVVVIGLTTPLEACLASIADRRKARGDDRELDPKNTTARASRLERHYTRLRDGGCEVERLDREAAYRRVLELLGAA